MPFDLAFRAVTLAEAYNRLYDAPVPELVRPLIAAGLQGLERTPGKGDILVAASGHISDGPLHPPADTTIAIVVRRAPPAPALEPVAEATDAAGEQPAADEQDGGSTDGDASGAATPADAPATPLEDGDRPVRRRRRAA